MKSTIIPSLAITAVLAAMSTSGHASPLLSEPVIESKTLDEKLRKAPDEIQVFAPVVDVSVSKTQEGKAVGDDIYVNIPTLQTLRQTTVKRPVFSFFRLQNEFFKRMFCEKECLVEMGDERDRSADKSSKMIPYLYMNTVAGTPSIVGASRGDRNFDIRYHDLTGGGNVTGKMIRDRYRVNVTTESDVIIRQFVKPTRSSKYRNVSNTATLKAYVDTSAFSERMVYRAAKDGNEEEMKFFLDGSAVEINKKADKKKKRKKKSRRPRRPADLF